MERRARSWAVVGIVLAVVGVSLFLLPAPWWLAASVTALGLVLLLTRRWHWHAADQRAETLVVDDQGVRRIAHDGREEQVQWNELVQVSIVTTEEDGLNEDLFFLLQTDDGAGCVVSSDLAVGTGLLARLHQLPGFDGEALVQASGCSIDAHFVCWRGEPGDGLAAAQILPDPPSSLDLN